MCNLSLKHTNIHSTCSPNDQKLETIQKLFKWVVVTQPVVYTHHVMLLSNKKGTSCWCTQVEWIFKELGWVKKVNHKRYNCMISFISYSFFLILFLLYFTLQYCIGFATHWHESTMGVYELPMFIAALYISYSWNAKILEMQNKLVVVRD